MFVGFYQIRVDYIGFLVCWFIHAQILPENQSNVSRKIAGLPVSYCLLRPSISYVVA